MPLKVKTSKIQIAHDREGKALRIVADGGVANPNVGDGRMIPLLILDTSERPDLEEYIRVHRFSQAGDVRVQWGQMIGHTNGPDLILRFIRPVELVAIIEFDLDRNHGILVEQILASKGLYIQAGREGDRLKHDLNVPKVILEVPDTGFKARWDKFYLQHATAKMRSEGLERGAAKRAAKQFVKEVRAAASFRLAPSANPHAK